MTNRKPLIAYTMFIGDDEPNYDVYTDAYGLEMTIDDEWEIDAVIVVPGEYLHVLESETDIAAEGIGAGTTSFPSETQPYEDSDWFVLSLDEDEFDIALIGNRKLIAVSRDQEKLKAFVNSNSNEESPLTAIALPIGTDEFEKVVSELRRFLDDSQQTDVRIIAYIDSNEVDFAATARLANVDGFYHTSSSYGELLDIMAELGSDSE